MRDRSKERTRKEKRKGTAVHEKHNISITTRTSQGKNDGKRDTKKGEETNTKEKRL
jgi:hypothetical protein